MLDNEISSQEVKNEIQKLENNNASLNDIIANEIIKASSDVISPILFEFYSTQF